MTSSTHSQCMLALHPVDDTGFKRTMASFATGVTIVTTRDAAHKPIGLTVSSFNSVSLHPPLVLWSLTKASGSLAAFQNAPYFAINILADQQLELSRRFATRGIDRFAQTPWQAGVADMPLLEGCLGWLVCRTRSQYDEGDHIIFIGEVEQCAHQVGLPLVHHSSQYFVTQTHPDIA